MELSRVGLGAWVMGGSWESAWGPQADADSIETIRHAVGRGVNWIDTAAIYGYGHSEEVIGEALRRLAPEVRPSVFTKGGIQWSDGRRNDLRTRSLEPSVVRREVEDSRRRLGVEAIDLYQFHWPDLQGTPVEASWEALAALQADGKLRAIGVSNFTVDLLERCESVRHVDSLQPPFSLLNRAAAVELLPWCVEHGTGVIVYSPLQSGLLSGSYTPERVRALAPEDWRRRTDNFVEPQLSRNLALVDSLRPIAEDRGVTVAVIALAWVLAWPGVTGVIVGARAPSQVDGWVAAAELQLSEAELDRIAEAIEQTGAGSGPPRPPARDQ